jgi:3D (Asp-Asp-Asp) domain-containing protein
MLLAGILPSSGGAEPAPALRSEADERRAGRAGLAKRANAALLELYAAESALAHAREHAEASKARLAALEVEQASASRRARVLAASLDASRDRVASALRALYIEGEPDPVAVLLGATSLDEAIEGIEGLSRAVAQNRRLAADARDREARLVTLRAALAQRRVELVAQEQAAAAGVAALEQRARERAAVVSALRRQSDLAGREIAALEQRARDAELASRGVVGPPGDEQEPEGEPDPPTRLPAPGGTTTLVVDAVAYHLRGSTASGLPVGPGIIAVDPRVIPLGTRVFVPGYGPAVAADTGSAIVGTIIDLWMPSTAAARAWGRRTVTITIYG